MSNEITTTRQTSVFANVDNFETAQRIATALSKSDLIPTAYKNNMPNCLIALEVAQRTNSSPLMVMQNLNIIHGRPSWSSQFIIGALNSCGRFSPLRFRMTGEGDTKACIASTVDNSGEILEGPEVSIQMAKDEGWYTKNGSKWKTMPDLMLRYRAASFFGRLYAPDVLMGMYSADEVEEVDALKDVTPVNSVVASLNEQIKTGMSAAHTVVMSHDGTAPMPIVEPVVASSEAAHVVLEYEEMTTAELEQITKDIIITLENIGPEKRLVIAEANYTAELLECLGRKGRAVTANKLRAAIASTAPTKEATQ
jgi:hypothetical protein